MRMPFFVGLDESHCDGCSVIGWICGERGVVGRVRSSYGCCRPYR